MKYARPLLLIIVIIMNACESDAGSNSEKLVAQFYGASGSNEAGGAVLGSDGSLYIAGYTYYYDFAGGGSPSAGFRFLKISTAGTQVWSKYFSDPSGFAYGYAVALSPDNGFLLSGNASGGNLMILKTNELGDTVWVRKDGAPATGRGICAEADSGFTIAGSTYPDDLYLMRIDKNGNKLWDKTYGGAGLDEAQALAKTQDGGYIVVGVKNNTGDFGNVYIVRTNVNGDSLWTRAYPSSIGVGGHSVLTLSDGSFMIAGNKATDDGTSIAMIMKINADGNLIWNKSFKKGFYRSIAPVSDGFVATGVDVSDPDEDEGDVAVIKIDAAGNTIFYKVFGTAAREVGRVILSQPGGGLIVAGSQTNGSAGPIFVMRLTDDGSNIQ